MTASSGTIRPSIKLSGRQGEPQPPGKQCDEYPFASTWQGAKSGGGNFSRRMINAKQNEDGGRALSKFYLYNRIVEKDKFLVWIK